MDSGIAQFFPALLETFFYGYSDPDYDSFLLSADID